MIINKYKVNKNTKTVINKYKVNKINKTKDKTETKTK